MVQITTNTFCNREQEREAKAQERKKRIETRDAQMLATLQGSPMEKPEYLKNKTQGKCLISRQVEHWAGDKSPKMAFYQSHNWDTGWHSALGTQKPQGQAPSFPS